MNRFKLSWSLQKKISNTGPNYIKEILLRRAKVIPFAFMNVLLTGHEFCKPSILQGRQEKKLITCVYVDQAKSFWTDCFLSSAAGETCGKIVQS